MIAVVAEYDRGAIGAGTREAIAAASELAAGAPVVLLCLVPRAEDVPPDAAHAGADSVAAIVHPALGGYTADAWVAALESCVANLDPGALLLSHSYRSRDFAPRIAARLDWPIVTDAVAIEGTPEEPGIVRPMFQGKLTALVRPEKGRRVVITVQIGAFAPAPARSEPVPVNVMDAVIDPAALRQAAEPPFQQTRPSVDLGQAARIVAVGRGIKAREHLAVVERLAAALGAELAASRPICDNGWLPMERQVGSSGQTVAPRLYVAVGVSGAIQHLAGMRGARVVVAINKDPDAPIFEVADYGIVGDLFEVVPALTAALGRP